MVNKNEIRPVTFVFPKKSNFFVLINQNDLDTLKAAKYFIQNKEAKGILKRPKINGWSVYTDTYINETGSLIDTLKNYFTDCLLKDSVLYCRSIEYSLILQMMNEPILSNNSDSLVVRLVMPVIGSLGLEYFNSIRIHFYNDSTKAFQTKSKQNKARYEPVENNSFLIKDKMARDLRKDLSMLNFKYPSLLYNPDSYPYFTLEGYPMLLEYKIGSEYHIYFIRDFYYGKPERLNSKDALLFKEIIREIRKIMGKK